MPELACEEQIRLNAWNALGVGLFGGGEDPQQGVLPGHQGNGEFAGLDGLRQVSRLRFNAALPDPPGEQPVQPAGQPGVLRHAKPGTGGLK